MICSHRPPNVTTQRRAIRWVSQIETIMEMAAMIALVLGFFAVGILARAAWVMLTTIPDVPPETQDNFHISATRWGYVGEKRQGE